MKRFIPLIVLLVLAIAFASYRKDSRKAMDFFNYWVVAKSLAQDRTLNVYDDKIENDLRDYWTKKFTPHHDQHIQDTVNFREAVGLHLVATPFLFACTSIFALLDFDASYLSFQILQLLLALAAITLFLRELKLPWNTVLILNSIFFFVFTPIHWEVDIGNGCTFQLLAASLLVYLLNRQHYLAAGLVTGIAIGLKPNFLWIPTAVFIFWLSERQWRPAMKSISGALLGLCSAFVISKLYWGSDAHWSYWYQETFVKLVRREDYLTKYANLSPIQIIFEITNINQVLLGTVFAVLWLIVLFLTSPAARSQKNYAYLIAVGSMGLLLVPKIVWFNYLLMIIPALLLLAKNYKGLKNTQRALLVFALMGILVDPDWAKGHEFLQALINATGVMIIFTLLMLSPREPDLPLDNSSPY